MVLKRADASAKRRHGINKLTLGFASLAAAAVIGTTGVAAAQTASKPANHAPAHGYGGNTANVELNVNQSGSNNVVNIILNLFQ